MLKGNDTMQKLQIYTSLMLVMVIWGATFVSIKILVQYFHPITLTALRISLAAICLFCFLYFRKKLINLAWQEWKWVLLATIFGVIFHHVFLSIGLSGTSSVKGSIISGFSPLLTVILSILVGYAKFKLSNVIGFLLGTVGVIFAVSAGQSIDYAVTKGDIYVFLSFLSQAISFIIIRRLSNQMETIVLTCYMLCIGAILLVATSLVVLPSGYAVLFEVPFWVTLLVIGTSVLAISVGHTVYNLSIAKVGPAETAIIGNFNVIFALIFSLIILKEPLILTQIIGMVVILIGVLLGTGALQKIVQSIKQKKRENLF